MAKNIIEALVRVQEEAPDLQKNAVNTHFKNRYISLESLLPQILPVLKSNGLLLLQMMDNVEGKPALRTRLIHTASGEEIEGLCPLELDRTSPQAVGSSVTYYRRYALMTMLNLIADADDDGEAATAPSRTKPADLTNAGSVFSTPSL